MRFLTPQLSAYGRPLPCARLRQLVDDPDHGICGHSKVFLRALALAALQVQFAECLVSEAEDRALLKRRKRVNEACNGTPFEISNLDLQIFGDNKRIRLALNPALTQLLQKIRPGFVKELMAWAPPLISEGRKNKPPIVVGNQIILALHRFYFPGQSVSAHRLDTKTGTQLSATDLAQAVLQAFCPIVDKHRLYVIRSAQSMDQVAMLAGVCRSTAAAHRAKYGVLKL